METVTKDEFYIRYEEYLQRVIDGAIFVYPTDTIYGLGCNALHSQAVKKLKEIKGRPSKMPFSIIAPSKEWVIENCDMDEKIQEWIEQLPGPITLILNLKNKNCVCPEVLGDNGTIGIRIPKHWIRGFVRQMGVPIVTTSVNESGKRPMMSPEEIESTIKPKVNFLIDEGALNGTPSKIVHLEGEQPQVQERKK